MRVCPSFNTVPSILSLSRLTFKASPNHRITSNGTSQQTLHPYIPPAFTNDYNTTTPQSRETLKFLAQRGPTTITAKDLYTNKKPPYDININEYATTTANIPLYTSALAPCVGLIMQNKTHHFLAHIASNIDTTQIVGALKEASLHGMPLDDPHLRVYIREGEERCHTINDIYFALKPLGLLDRTLLIRRKAVNTFHGILSYKSQLFYDTATPATLVSGPDYDSEKFTNVSKQITQKEQSTLKWLWNALMGQ